MPIYDLNAEQRKAAVSRCAEIAVSAGAGSGKTRLLVARYLHYVMKDRLSLNSIAAITFTNKAADQMKARVAARARELSEENAADSAFWKKVAAGVHHAPISTIHSFCSGILRAHPVEAGIDPAFTVLDDVTTADLRSETIDSFILKRQSDIPDDMSFLADVFGITGLKQIYHSLLLSRPHVVKFLDMFEHESGINETSFINAYQSSQKERLNEYLETIKGFHAFRPAGDGFVQEYDSFKELIGEIVTMLEMSTIDPDRIEIEIGMLNFRKGSAPKWGTERLRRLKTEMKGCRELIERIIAFERKEKHIVPKTAALVLREFVLLDNAYLKRKKSLSGYDHDDILIETWRLLRSNVRLCREISHSFKHILVDEFQDTDGIQMDILNMIAGNSSAVLFTVGDPKQSIYRFRGADVSVFNMFISRVETDFHRLTTNYRSTPSVMTFVNTVFENIIGNEPGPLFEAVYSPMKPYRKEIDQSGPSVDIFVIDGSDVNNRRAKEAELIARRITEFRNKGIRGKRYRYSDMAILLRKGTSVGFYEEALMRSGIPYVNRIGGRLSGNPVAYDIGNLLGWLNAPENSALLTAVLLSPFIGFDADTVFRLRLLAGSAENMPSFLLGRRSDGDTQFDLAAGILSGLLRHINRTSIRALLEDAFDRSGYTAQLLADTVRGEQSLAVTDLILETADRFEENGGTSAGFAELLLSGREFAAESAQVETEGDAVPVLTIHGAKGLEFPVVFLADIPTGTKGGRKNTVLFDDNLGPGFNIRNERGASVETYASWHVGRENRKRDIAENKRLFYVGSTRAEDYLVILGEKPKKSDALYEQNNWMSWLYASLDIPVDDMAESVTTDIYRMFRVDDKIDVPQVSMYDFWRTVLADAEKTVSKPVRISDTLIGDIPPVMSTGVPLSLSPTKLIEYRACPARYYFRYVHGLDLSFSDREGSNVGAAYGDFAHHVMEKIDLAHPDSWPNTAQILYDQSLPEHLLTSLVTDLKQFAESSVYHDFICPADEIRREEPFTMLFRDAIIRGSIDLYCRMDDNITIIDYKTTSSVPETLDDIPERYRFQLGLYSLAVYNAQHVTPSRLILQFLGAGKSFELPCNQLLVNEIEKTLEDVLERMDRNDFSPMRGERCGNCPYEYLCRR